jgi:protein CpxP
MKRKILVAAMAALLGWGTAFAQEAGRQQRMPATERAKAAVEKMSVLDLTAEARTGATTVMTEFYQSMDKAIAEMRQSGAIDREALLATRRRLVAARDEQLKKLFTEEQMSRFLKEVEPTLRPQRQGNAN